MTGPIAIGVMVSRYNEAKTKGELKFYSDQVVKPAGFLFSPQLDNISGGFTFVSDTEIIHLNEGTTKVKATGIWHESGGNGFTLQEKASDGSIKCSAIARKGIRFNLESMTGIPYKVDEKFPADKIFDTFYVYPAQLKNRLQGSCGPVIISLDGTAKTSKVPASDREGDVYWEPVGGFIDKINLSVKRYDRPALNRKIPVDADPEGRNVRKVIGVAYDGRLSIMLNNGSDTKSWICFGRYVNGKLVLEDATPMRTSDYENIAISLDGTLISYIGERSELGTYNLETRNLRTMEKVTVGSFTNTIVRSMMISPKNSYLAVQLQNAIIWKKI